MKVKRNGHFTFESVIIVGARNDHLTFETVIDSLAICSDENINSGAILFFDAVCMGSPESKGTNIREN